MHKTAIVKHSSLNKQCKQIENKKEEKLTLIDIEDFQIKINPNICDVEKIGNTNYETMEMPHKVLVKH